MTFIRKIAPWKAVYKCFYSQDIYRDAAHCWRGLGYKYLLAVLFAAWLIAAVHVQLVVREFIVDYLKPVFMQLPTMSVKNGVMKLDGASELVQIKDPRDGHLLVSFDMREEPKAPPADKIGIFVERRRVILHSKDKQQVYDFKNLKDTVYDWTYHIKILDGFANWSGVVVVGVFWISSFVLCALQALLYGLAGKLIAVFAKRRLTYAQLVRISVVAMTPALIIDTCQKLLCAGIPVWPLVSVCITVAFLIYGVKVNSVSFEWSLTQAVPPVPVEKNSTA